MNTFEVSCKYLDDTMEKRKKLGVCRFIVNFLFTVIREQFDDNNIA